MTNSNRPRYHGYTRKHYERQWEQAKLYALLNVQDWQRDKQEWAKELIGHDLFVKMWDRLLDGSDDWRVIWEDVKQFEAAVRIAAPYVEA